MTHNSGTDYMEYVAVLSGNPLARKVKMADLRHNMDLSRLDEAAEADLARVEKHKHAYSLLEEAEQKGCDLSD